MRTSLAALVLAASWPGPAVAAEVVPRPSIPAVAVLVADQGPFDTQPSPWWAPARGGAAPGRSGNTAITAALGDGSVRLLDLAPQAGRVAAAGVGAGPLPPARARELARLLGADVLVHGTAVAADEEDGLGVLEQSSGMKGSSTGQACTVAVTVRVHRADTGQVIAESATSARSTAFRAADCSRTAAIKAVQAMTPDLRERILAYWRARPGA